MCHRCRFFCMYIATFFMGTIQYVVIKFLGHKRIFLEISWGFFLGHVLVEMF